MKELLKFFLIDDTDAKSLRRSIVKLILTLIAFFALIFFLVICSVSTNDPVASTIAKCLADGKEVTEIFGPDGKLLKIICHPKNTSVSAE